MENPVVTVRRTKLLDLHRQLNGAASLIRSLLAESELREYSDTCLTGIVKSDKSSSQD